MRIAVLTLEAAAAAAAVRRFVADHADDIALVGLSNPYGGRRGGMLRQGLRHLRRSGVRFLPYLAVNFVAPALAEVYLPGAGWVGPRARKGRLWPRSAPPGASHARPWRT